jgi:hypothetical protein
VSQAVGRNEARPASPCGKRNLFRPILFGGGGIGIRSTSLTYMTRGEWKDEAFTNANHVQPEARSFLKSNLRTFLWRRISGRVRHLVAATPKGFWSCSAVRLTDVYSRPGHPWLHKT